MMRSMSPAQRNLVDLQQRLAGRRCDLAGIEMVFRVESPLDLLQAGIEIAEEFGHIFGTHALAVLPPENAAISARQRDDGIA